jgi:hypothetical protein
MGVEPFDGDDHQVRELVAEEASGHAELQCNLYQADGRACGASKG